MQSSLRRFSAAIILIAIIFVVSALIPPAAHASSTKASVKLPKKITIGLGMTYTIAPTLSDSLKEADQKWSSSRSKNVSVTQSGTIKGVKKGSSTITLKVGKYSAKCTVSVVSAQSIKVDGKTVKTPVKATPTPAVTSAPTSMSAILEALLKYTNEARAKHGLPALRADADLFAAGQVRAKELEQKFSHTRPNGADCFSVSPKVFGENIAFTQTNGSADAIAKYVLDAWMDSPGHKANILHSEFKTIGLGYHNQGKTHYWVQVFGH